MTLFDLSLEAQWECCSFVWNNSYLLPCWSEVHKKDMDKEHLFHAEIIRIPGIWDMSFHNCAHGHTRQCPPCISARAFAGFPSPLVPRMILQLHNWCQMNNQVLDVQEKLAMVAFAYRLMPSNAQWTCIARFLPSSHVQCQLCRSGTCHNRWSTWKMKIILFTLVSCTSRN